MAADIAELPEGREERRGRHATFYSQTMQANADMARLAGVAVLGGAPGAVCQVAVGSVCVISLLLPRVRLARESSEIPSNLRLSTSIWRVLRGGAVARGRPWRQTFASCGNTNFYRQPPQANADMARLTGVACVVARGSAVAADICGSCGGKRRRETRIRRTNFYRQPPQANARWRGLQRLHAWLREPRPWRQTFVGVAGGKRGYGKPNQVGHERQPCACRHAWYFAPLS